MKKQSIEKQQIAPEMVLNFLENTLPFKDLEQNTLRELSRQCIIDFYPKDTLISQQDITDIAYLYIIQQGAPFVDHRGTKTQRGCFLFFFVALCLCGENDVNVPTSSKYDPGHQRQHVWLERRGDQRNIDWDGMRVH